MNPSPEAIDDRGGDTAPEPPVRAALIPAPGHRPAQGATAAVLLLHGGRADALSPPPRLNLPALRMRPFAAAVTRATAHDDVFVAHVRYRYRGWNGHHAHPVADVRRALDELRAAAGPIPVVLVGHSMGGRAALRAAEDPQVEGVVALAPWCPPGHPPPICALAGSSPSTTSTTVSPGRRTPGPTSRAPGRPESGSAGSGCPAAATP
ncbi:alpha/beta hydrolase [Streptomyces erythrochromogenes]|uniref:alpha/beta hydrolase n=1 Tax=Streptomyces erythrochromogenes TaxID=285574 RepID=UPI00381FA7AB